MKIFNDDKFKPRAFNENFAPEAMRQSGNSESPSIQDLTNPQ